MMMRDRRQALFTGCFLSFCLIAFLAPTANGLIHKLSIKNDRRGAFRIETFGFFKGGTMQMTIENFESVDDKGLPWRDRTAGFIVKHTETDSGSFIEETEASKCTSLLQEPETPDTIPVPITDQAVSGSAQEKMIEIKAERPQGFYTVVFLNCNPGTYVSFDLTLVNVNPGPNYLSAGLTALPTLYALLFVVWTVALGIWIFHFMRGEGKRIFRIHHLITGIVLLKLLTLLFEAIEFHYKKTTGHPGGWVIAFYIFSGLKGTMMFIVIALIGTGWAFIKPFLGEKDKNIFLVVIPLQILANIAIIVLEETAPGSQGWFTWKEVLRLVDIICCGAILVPIIWSIKHLRDAAAIDGKAKRNMEKLQLFREFYLLVVTYIYFTRIIVFLLDATLHYQYVWLGEFFTELATLIFWGLTAYKFRPVADNPYLKLDEDEEDAEREEAQRQARAEGGETIVMEPLEPKNIDVTIN
jgi:hypothetical protein